MRTKKPDNCIPFDDIAQEYDKTRYFSENGARPTFEHLIKIIQVHFRKVKVQNNTLRFFDAGTGTGRVIIPFILQLIEFLKQYSIGKIRCFEFYCLDISKPMLERFKEKIKQCDFDSKDNNKVFASFYKDIPAANTSINLFLIEGDLRTYQKELPYPFFDAVFVHWVFHTIRDWHIALLNIYSVSKPNSLLFTFEESSSLYYAIDNNLHKIGQQNQQAFWIKYFQVRKKIYNHYNLLPTPASERIGSHVQDKKIYELICRLYSRPKNNKLKTSQWEARYKYKYIIETIIGKQLFSNMKLVSHADDVNPYKEISQTLLSYYNDNDANFLDLEFISKTKFRGYYFCLPEERYGRIEPDLQMAILKNAIESRSPEDLFVIPARAYDVFLNLFYKDVCFGLYKDAKIKFIVGVHFFDETNDTHLQIKEDFAIYSTTQCDSDQQEKLKEIWININKSNDRNHPFLITLKKHRANSKNAPTPNYSSLSVISIGQKAIDDLLGLCGHNINDCRAYVEKIPQSQRLLKIQENAIASRITHVLDEDIHAFFNGITAIVKLSQEYPQLKLRYFYFFPSHFVSPFGEPKNFGLMLVSESTLDPNSVLEIDNYSSILFKTLSKDIRLDLSINPPVVVIKHKKHTPPESEVDPKRNPNILILTSFANEFEQALKLAGVVKSNKEKRRLEIPNLYDGKRLPAVYDISSSDFGKDMVVWLFQSFQTGNGEFGVEYTLRNLLEYIKKAYSNKLPDLIVMGGVAAGLQEHNQLIGNLIIPDTFWFIQNINNLNKKISISAKKVMSYYGKISKDLIEQIIIQYINELNEKSNNGDNVYLTKYKQQIFRGSLVTVDSVINDYTTKNLVIEKIVANDNGGRNGRKKGKDSGSNIIGLEMEGYGFASVCEEYKVPYFLCKGISDFAYKKDRIGDFQKNVAKNAFDFIYYFIKQLNKNTKSNKKELKEST